MRPKKPCANCGKATHIECCKQCEYPVPVRRRGSGFCSQKCDQAQKDDQFRKAGGFDRVAS